MNLQKVQSLRDGHRAVIKRYLEKINAAKEETSMIEFDAILESLESKVKTLESLNEKIISQTEVDGIEEELIQTEEYSLELEITLRRLRDFRHPGGRSSESQQTHFGIPQFSSQTVSNISSNFSQYHRLPKLSLPTFNGDILQWQAFWDSFESTIHLNANLTDVQKFNYLKSQLECDAAKIIEGFALTNANYARAVELLKERFGQQHKITHTTMQALIQLPNPTSCLSSMRHFYDRMETYIRGLESLGQYQEAYGSLLVPVILDKLPGDIRKQLARENGDNNWQLDGLRRAICREINIIETGSSRHLPEVGIHEPTALFYTGAGSKHQPSIQQMRPATSKSERKPEVKCSFCDESHISIDCRKYSDVDSRITVVKQKRLCYNCLGKHQVSKCKSNRRCRKCHRKHHTSICKQRVSSQPVEPSPEVPASRPETAVYHSSTQQSSSGVLLKTAIATICSRDTCTDATILFDEGAQKSFITENLAKELQLCRDGTETVSLSAFGDSSNKVQHLDTATIYLLTETDQKIPIRTLVVPTIATPISNHIHHAATKLPYLQNLKLAHPVTSDSSFTISVLIGADYYWDVIEDHVIRGEGPTAVKSKIGYLLSGPLPTTSGNSNHIFNIISSLTSRVADEEALERFWSLESMGIEANLPDRKSAEYLKEYQRSSIDFKDGKYYARLPWKQNHPVLPSNYDITRRRTESTIRRLRNDPEVLKKYGLIITEQERRGFIEKVPDTADIPKQVHYIPHHPVKKESSTTPIRIVYDCSCRQSRDFPSLNDCLESTPPVLNELTSILVRFRLYSFAVITDIEKAFLHVGLHEDDRDVTRFLWLSDPDDPDSPLSTYRFKAVLFGATCSPFMLNATLLKHLHLNRDNIAAEVLERDLYVDNVLSSFIHQTDVLTYFQEARSLMSMAGMNLRSWTSNSDILRRQAAENMVLDADDVSKILGLRWEPSTDMMSFARREIPLQKDVTKRTILKHSSRIYDPLGILSPLTVRAKLLLQELWIEKYDWDVPLPVNDQKIWNNLAKDLSTATEVKFPRRYHQRSSKTCRKNLDVKGNYLHVFVDASIRAYGAAAYITNISESTLVMVKSRVAPLKQLTLPQLELMAALVGARLANHLQLSLNAVKTIFWSESQIVLHWLSTNKPLKRFVRNRVTEIQELTNTHSWRYCPTHENPADLLTRGISADQFIKSDLWRRGPIWICENRKWPHWEVKPSDDQKTDYFSEQTTTDIYIADPSTTQTTNVTSLQCSTVNLQAVIDIERYSTYSKLLRVTAYVSRFMQNCQNKGSRRLGPLTTDELQTAAKMWLTTCQATTFHEEISNIKSRGNRSPLVKQLRLFLDDAGHIRCGGRIHNAPLDEITKFPYLLPKKHALTKFIVQDAHENHLHAGINATVTCLRQKYWIPAARQCVKSIIRKCVTCKRVVGKAYSAPDPPPLPKMRVQEAPPFSVTGVDFTGALYVKEKTGSESKVYICLFTCAVTRAVHLEFVQNLSEDAFLQAFRRFVSRKSLPKLMVSDNATTYMAAASHLKRLFESQAVKETLSRQGTDWQFIPKRAPWYGGWWERLIGLTKTTLKKILGRSYVDLETLQTIITEIEAVMNDRPLTMVSSNLEDPEPLTPAHLLYGRRMTSLPYTDALDTGSTPADVGHSATTKRAMIQNRIIGQFWKRWKTEYLTALREHHRTTGSNSQNIGIGDVVQVHDDSPRVRWKLAVVEELMTGNDGLTRAAKIRTSNGLSSRPVSKLYPLEIVNDSE